MNGQLAVVKTTENSDSIKKAIGPTAHWVGARCKRYPAYSSFFWVHSNGTKEGFLEPVHGESLMGVCDAKEAGIVITSTGYEDEI